MDVRADTRRIMRLSLILFSLLAAFTAFASHPAPIEDHNFGLEAGWNRDDAAMQYSTFLFRDTSAFELSHEWALSARHQLSYAVPVFSHDGETGLGETTLNYRYQLAGGSESRFAVAPRVSLLLPTRSAYFGERSSGLEVNVPVSAAITPRLTSHTNFLATWFRDLGQRELTAAQGITFVATSRLEFALDAAYKRYSDGSKLLVVRPGVQFGFDLGRVRVAPGVALPIGEGVLFFVAVEQSLP